RGARNVQVRGACEAHCGATTTPRSPGLRANARCLLGYAHRRLVCRRRRPHLGRMQGPDGGLACSRGSVRRRNAPEPVAGGEPRANRQAVRIGSGAPLRALMPSLIVTWVLILNGLPV